MNFLCFTMFPLAGDILYNNNRGDTGFIGLCDAPLLCEKVITPLLTFFIFFTLIFTWSFIYRVASLALWLILFRTLYNFKRYMGVEKLTLCR